MSVINKINNDSKVEINLNDLILALWKKKRIILLVLLISSASSVSYSLSLPNVYTSKALLAPVNPEESLSSKLGSLSALGSFTGLGLSSSSAPKNQEAIERIKSFEFFSTHFLPNIKLENIMANIGWIPLENVIIYDEKLFDKNTNKWVRKTKFPKKTIPSSQEAFEVYSNILSIREDKKTSFVTISIEHHSPIVAKKWVDIIINRINQSMRKNDVKFAEDSISYLNIAAQSTDLQSSKEAIVQLLKNQMQTLMLASSNDSYVFKIIDPPIISEEKTKPSRALISILGTFLGGFFAVLIILIQYFRNPSEH